MQREALAAPDVSVLVITHNHERYIARNLMSVFGQQGVSFEIIVSEDASTDGTLPIIRALTDRDPRVRLILSEQNLACNHTILRAIRAARGRYISLLDGDDFWISDTKLARQVELLDDDATLAACFHNAIVVDGDGDRTGDDCWTPRRQAARIGLADIWLGNPFATAAGLMRREAIAGIGDWYGELGRTPGTAMITDWPLYIACAETGDLAFVDEPVAAYRLHAGGEFSSRPARRKLDVTAALYREMDAGFGYRHHRLAQSGAARYFSGWMVEFGSRQEHALARRCLWLSLRLGGLRRPPAWLRLARRAWAAAW